MNDTVLEFLCVLTFVGVVAGLGLVLFASDSDWRGGGGVLLIASGLIGFCCGLLESAKTNPW